MKYTIYFHIYWIKAETFHRVVLFDYILKRTGELQKCTLVEANQSPSFRVNVMFWKMVCNRLTKLVSYIISYIFCMRHIREWYVCVCVCVCGGGVEDGFERLQSWLSESNIWYFFTWFTYIERKMIRLNIAINTLANIKKCCKIDCHKVIFDIFWHDLHTLKKKWCA